MIPLTDYENPRFIRYKEGATLSRDDNARFDYVDYDNPRRWRIKPQPGYRSEAPSLKPIKINLRSDGITLTVASR